jgi:methylthioribose-1-phosphate isomerase
MISHLRTLVVEMETTLQRVSVLDAHVRDEMLAQIEDLKKAINDADAEENRQLAAKGLNLLATLLSVITNVTTLLK